MSGWDSWHSVLSFCQSTTKIYYFITHPFSLSVLRDPSTDMREAVSGFPSTSHLHSHNPFTQVSNTMHTNPVCSHFIYPLVKAWNNLTSPVEILIDTSTGQHSMILWLQLSHNIFLQLQFAFTILTQLSHLYLRILLVCITILLIINIQYHFDSPSLYNVKIYIPLWHKVPSINKFQWYINLI